MALVTIAVDPGVGAGRKEVGFDEISSAFYQIVKLMIGAEGTAQLLDANVPSVAMPVRLSNGSGFYAAGSPPVAGTATLTTPTMGVASTTLLAANANRLGAVVFNPLSVNLFVNMHGAAAATDATVCIGPRGSWNVPFNYTGALTGVLASGSGDVAVTELTA